MNFISKKFGKKLICNCLITSMLLLIFHRTGFITSLAQEQTPEFIKVIGEEIDPISVSTNNNTEIESVSLSISENESIIVKECVTEETIKVMKNLSDSSEIVVSEIIIPDEEKWAAVSTSCEPYIMFVNVSMDSSLNIRSQATIGDNVVGGLHYGDQVTVVGYNTYDQSWTAIEYRDKIAFVSDEYLEEWVDLSLRKDTTYQNPEWDGETKLNDKNGRIEGPSGQETYYNLPMDRCIYYMNILGYNYEVWVRDDGVKMFGDYIMVAANLETRPKGSLVETSLGTGIVVDTGEFVNWNPNGIDIAVTW